MSTAEEVDLPILERDQEPLEDQSAEQDWKRE
jgi:hypothetical protein